MQFLIFYNNIRNRFVIDLLMAVYLLYPKNKTVIRFLQTIFITHGDHFLEQNINILFNPDQPGLIWH